MKLVGFLNLLLVSLFSKCTSMLWDMLALRKAKYISWILHVCWI